MSVTEVRVLAVVRLAASPHVKQCVNPISYICELARTVAACHVPTGATQFVATWDSILMRYDPTFTVIWLHMQ